MNFKRLSAAALAAALATSVTPAFAAEEHTPVLISAKPVSDTFTTEISVNGTVLESYEYEQELPNTWETETISVTLSELIAVPAGYVPLRAIVQADQGSASWFKEEKQSFFYLNDSRIITDFNDMSIEVNDEKLEGVTALLLDGVTYIPVSVLAGLEGIEVVDNSTDDKESYAISTPNGSPLMLLANSLMETAQMSMTSKTTIADLEGIYGDEMGFKAEYVTEGVAFLPMITSPDTLVIGKMADGAEKSLKKFFEEYRKNQETTFSWYLSDNLPKVENAQFVTEGDWFMFLIAENTEDTIEQFKAGVKEM